MPCHWILPSSVKQWVRLSKVVGINLSPDCNFRLGRGKQLQRKWWGLRQTTSQTPSDPALGPYLLAHTMHTKCSWTSARFWSTNRWWWIQAWEWAYTISTRAKHIKLSSCSKPVEFLQSLLVMNWRRSIWGMHANFNKVCANRKQFQPWG